MIRFSGADIGVKHGFDPQFFFHLPIILFPFCLYCLNCTKFGHLVVKKMIKIVGTRCHILRLKCTSVDFGCGSTPAPAEGAHSAPQTPIWI